ncbi:enoyl-CoA hydratase-related protein [Paratissierella segnis]|jgi:enoyl-CoA hydratase|uniref:Enoyl-CoA hydratase/isomerase family protein n=1 Tax=Paratissierella segnis TaxID=2763679 RepID=A0A926ES88_9FIRM|nr:enoyl-CoA hydratase-related protein [Paratissierella segnis]MBC8587921.1 enoyl-CoA hydratase/isomerase family protein [Paratissierella segnis]
MTYENVLLTKEGKIGLLTINRPDVLNSLNSNLLDELNDAIDSIERDGDLYVLIFTGSGKAFIAGADIGEMKDFNSDEARSFANKGVNLFRKVELLKIPTIAAVNGFALGGGCELCLSCDIRIASEKAKFGQPEVGLGIIPGFGGTQRLTRLVGSSVAKELIFTGEVIDTKRAEKIGLVNKVVHHDYLMPEAFNIASKIVTKGQISVRYAKEAINRGFGQDIEAGMEIEKELFVKCFDTEDQKEGMIAFLESRTPSFNLK